ncbi:ComEC/Rec2-related protein domain-containing protein [Sphingomonas antarctica]
MHPRHWGPRVEAWLEVERDQLFLWTPVMLGVGVAAWFVLLSPVEWLAFLGLCAGVALVAAVAASGTRLRRALLWSAALAALGCGLSWGRAERVAAPVIARPTIAQLSGRVERIDLLPARGTMRLTLSGLGAGLPDHVRVSVPLDPAPPAVHEGDAVSLRARLVAPQEPAVPGGYDFARISWFQGLGGVGKALGPITVTPAPRGGPSLRERLSAHIRAQIDGSAGGIASAFASGDRGGIAQSDEEAMRDSGLTHLLSVSGLHISAVVGAAFFLTLRLLALWPRLALRLPLVAIAAGAGAAAGIGYTLLTGAEVPTIRSCVAAVLVCVGIVLGRDAFTLRLVAAGALAVLLAWPESLVGPSFQLSFAAIATIVALHEIPAVKARFAKRDEAWWGKVAREIGALLLTGLAVEITLAPIALFHFHKQGLFGALANIVAIPLTTFVTMPLEALALLFDTVGLGTPFWWATGKSLDLLLWIARSVAAWPGARAALADMPLGAFALIIGGGIWLILWKTRARLFGLFPLAAGVLIAAAAPPPDLIVTGDGKHLAVRQTDGSYAILRDRAGDYVRQVLAERGGTLAELSDLDGSDGASCSADLCRATLSSGGRSWRVMATRTPYLVDRPLFEGECAAADIVVSDRRLPYWCRPRWLKADAVLLAKTGGLAIALSDQSVATVRTPGDAHPWVRAAEANFNSGGANRRGGPARGRGRRDTAAPRNAHSPDRGEHSRPLPHGNI